MFEFLLSHMLLVKKTPTTAVMTASVAGVLTSPQLRKFAFARVVGGDTDHGARHFIVKSVYLSFTVPRDGTFYRQIRLPFTVHP